MLTGNIFAKQKYDYNNDRFQKAFAFLKNTDLQALPVGITEICGDEVYASVQEYTTLPVEETPFESHRAYFDVQYVVEGEELFGCAPQKDCLPAGEYDPEKDIAFYQEPDQFSAVVLKAGDFVIVSPEEAHAPRRQTSNGPSSVKKIVVKVRI